VIDSRIHPPRDLAPGDYENAPVSPDAAVERVLAPAIDAVKAIKSKPIGVVVETTIRRVVPPADPAAGRPVSPLGQLFTDAMLASVPGADVALNNSGGGLRADLPAGPLTYNGVFEVMPFDNVMVRLRLTGRQLRQVFANYIPRGRVLGFSGVGVRADCAGGSIAVTMTRPSGAAIRDEEPVLAVITDFLAGGGDGILAPVMPEGGFPVDPNAPLARDVFADYLRNWKGPLREAPLIDSSRQLLWTNCRGR
jgi:5'-nucleotidase